MGVPSATAFASRASQAAIFRSQAGSSDSRTFAPCTATPMKVSMSSGPGPTTTGWEISCDQVRHLRTARSLPARAAKSKGRSHLACPWIGRLGAPSSPALLHSSFRAKS